MIRAAGERRIKLMELMIVRLLLIFCAVVAFCASGIYFTLLFAEAIDGPEYRQNGEHLKKLMQIEQSNLNAAKHLKEVP